MRAGLSGIGGGGSPGGWLDGAVAGISQGIASIGLNYMVDNLDIHPLLANIGFSAVASAINGTLQSMLPGNEDLDIFKFMFDTYKNSVLAFLGGVMPQKDDPQFLKNGVFDENAYNNAMNNYHRNYSWGQTAYISQIQDFSTITRERGLIEALNTYATGFFNSVAVNQIVSTGMTIGEYFKTKWDAGQTEKVTLENGETVDGVRAEDTETILLFDSEGNIVGLKEGKKLNFGVLGVDGEGKLGLLEGYISGEYVPGLGFYMDIENGNQTYAEIRDPLTGETLYYVKPRENGGYNYYTINGEYSRVNIADILNGSEYFLGEAELVGKVEYADLKIGSTNTDQFFIEGIVVKRTMHGSVKMEVIKKDTYTGWYYDRNTGDHVEVEYVIANNGNISVTINGDTITLDNLVTYMVYAAPLQIHLKNGAVLPVDGFGLDDMQELTMVHTGIAGDHDFIKSIETALIRVQDEDIPPSNRIGYMSAGSSTNEVDISSLELPNDPGLDKATMTVTNGVVTDIDWSGAIDPDRQLTSLLVSEDKGGTIKTDNTINFYGMQGDGKEVRFGTENSYLFMGGSPVGLTDKAKYVETERQIELGGMKYRIITKAYLDADALDMTLSSRTVTMIVKSDNTFAMIENEVTSQLGSNFDVDVNTYADLYGQLSMKASGLPPVLGKALSEMYRDLYNFTEGMN